MTVVDIVSRIYKLTKTNASSYLAADMLIDINVAYRDVVSTILDCDGRWQWDDDNRADLPIGTTTITSGQQDYAPAVTHLKILRVEIKDNGGTVFRRLEPIDQADVTYALDSTTTGVPQYYDKVGDSVFLYPIPNYTQSASLKLYFQRGPDEFTSGQVSAGTKEPGFNALFHDLIPMLVAYDYAIMNIPELAGGFLNRITSLKALLVKTYSKRDKDERQRLTMEPINFK